MSSVNTHHSAALSAQAHARFAHEIAKYPDDQKQSAVMACLAIAQQEQGFVSAESERVIAELLGMAPMAVHEVTTLQHVQPTTCWQVQDQRVYQPAMPIAQRAGRFDALGQDLGH
jgi:NADH:ubiquinone oxidoreductase subunit E